MQQKSAQHHGENRTNHTEDTALNRQDKTINMLLAGLSRAEYHSLAILLPKRLRSPVRLFDTGAPTAAPLDIILLSFGNARGNVQQLKDLQKRHPQTPLICIAKKPCPNAPMSIPWPLNINTLAERVNAALAQTATSKKTTAQEPPARPETQTKQPQTGAIWPTFDPARRLLGGLMRACEHSRKTGLAVELDTKSLGAYLVLPGNQVLTTTSRRTLRSLCAVSLVTSHFKINTIDPDSLEHVMASRYSACEQWPLEDFFWHVGHWSSHGQLPKNIGKHQVLRMKRWPNATRTPEPLTVIAISALLGGTPASPVTISHRLGISVSGIAAYVSGMYAAGLLAEAARAQPEPAPKKLLAAKPGKALKKLARRLFGQWRSRTETSSLPTQ